MNVAAVAQAAIVTLSFEDVLRLGGAPHEYGHGRWTCPAEGIYRVSLIAGIDTNRVMRCRAAKRIALFRTADVSKRARIDQDLFFTRRNGHVQSIGMTVPC